MSKTYRFSKADGLPHRNQNLTSQDIGKPVKKFVNHRERRRITREIALRAQEVLA